MENVHIVKNITPGKHGVYHVTLKLQQDGQVEIRMLIIYGVPELFAYEDAIEWIPFDRLSKLSNIELIGKGGFGSFLRPNFQDLTWKTKLKLLSKDLYLIHVAGYIHADFHSEGEIYGVMPYVAPEVLSGEKFTKAADIYGFGVIMSEMSIGQKPFDGCKLDNKLAVIICKGLRPEFACGTPYCYM
ncbi:hypothetical protein C2G38_2163829 [Gigaspora rosea]|uniref:Protein kinase domain-containing protein n=1 Tax=Gigaspora rosea TaxID=44941 RepID=A0A397VUJ8_9GLOM|nr:hypothetical protein C2G38_2163829 [Gigaspora rosea]